MRGSPILEQVLDIAERGRSFGVVLFSAQQFMSAVHSRVPATAPRKSSVETGATEIGTPDYQFLDNDLKTNLTRLGKGELIVTHAVYRQPVKIIFPRPAYLQRQPVIFAMPEEESLTHGAAKQLAERTLAAAQGATNEAEFRIPFQAAIAGAARNHRCTDPAPR